MKRVVLCIYLLLVFATCLVLAWSCYSSQVQSIGTPTDQEEVADEEGLSDEFIPVELELLPPEGNLPVTVFR